jgi:hypothetical protein
VSPSLELGSTPLHYQLTEQRESRRRRTCIPKQIPMILMERFRGSFVKSLMKDTRRVIHGCGSYADDAGRIKSVRFADKLRHVKAG